MLSARHFRDSAALRLAVSVLAGAVLAIAVAAAGSGPLGLLLGIAATHTSFVASGWFALWPMSAHATHAHVRREEFRPAAEEGFVLVTSLGALLGVAILLSIAGSSAGRLVAGVALFGVFAAWGSLHLMYTARYAFLYFETPEGGIDFNSDRRPAYRDFLYFSYNLGMAYQVSDTKVTSSEVRAVVLRHCLLSYVFGIGVLATTINLVTSVATG